jgi:hypothetical protein
MGVETNYRDGSANTTELMQRAFEDSGYVEKGHAKNLEWHEGLAPYEQANEARKDASAAPAKWLLEKAAESGGATAFKQGATRLFGKEVVSRASFGMNPAKSIAKTVIQGAAGAVSAEAMIGGGIIIAGGATILAAAKNMADGDRMRDHQDTIALDLATTQLLSLDPEYRHSVYKKYEGNCEPDTVMKLFRNADGSLTAYGREALPKLQAACDAGSRAAFDAVRSGDLSRFLKDHPDIAARRERDVAFAKGFDQVVFAASCGDGGHKLVEIKKAVDDRDARTSAPVTVRG